VIKAIRSSTKITRMMPDPEHNALVVRASDSLVADAEKLIQQLDRPPESRYGQPERGGERRKTGQLR